MKRSGWLALLLALAGCPVESQGPCRDYLAPQPAGVVDVPGLDEVSGLAVSQQNPGVLWLLEDSGGEAEVYAVDLRGHHLATLRVENSHNQDWEDLALGRCGQLTCLFIGDIGDNLNSRKHVTVWMVPEPILQGETALVARGEAIQFRYPEGSQDAEALAVQPDGSIIIITKTLSGVARVYSVLQQGGPGVRRASLLGVLGSDGLTHGLHTAVTAADVDAAGSALLVRAYGGMWEYALEHPLDRQMPNARRALPLPPELQGESAAWDGLQGGVWTVSEGPHPMLHHLACSGW